MGNFTFEEMNLMCIYNTGSRTGLIEALTEMCGELAPEETIVAGMGWQYATPPLYPKTERRTEHYANQS